MLKRMIQVFAPPVYQDDEDKTRKARYVNTITLTFMIIVIGYEVGTRAIRGSTLLGIADLILITLALILIAAWLLLKRGYLQVASVLLVILIWGAANGIAASGFGIRDTSYIVNFSIVVMTGLLLGWRASIIVTAASILSGFGLAYAEESGLIGRISYPPTSFAQDMTFIFGLNIVLLYLLINGLENEIKRSKINLEELEISNANLNNAQTDLEKQAVELRQRGLELETANNQAQRRVAEFQALAQIAQSTTLIRDLQELLLHIATVISDKFGFYHVGVFLLDDSNQYAVLSATNSEGGRKMIERKHRLRVGEQGIVGNVMLVGQPRIAMDVGADAIFFDNPELPDTHSEMALPLKSGDRIIGALDVQSTKTAAFTEEELQLLSLLASQVSLAIENARLFEETRTALAEAEAVSRRYTQEAWGRLPAEHNLLGYRYNLSGAAPLETAVDLSESDNGNQTESSNQFIIPIQLRGETIGNLMVQSPSPKSLGPDQIDLIKAVAERVALSAENARLFEETTRRAERERLVSDITGKIRIANDPQAMIQTAMDELRKALGASRVDVIPQAIKSSE